MSTDDRIRATRTSRYFLEAVRAKRLEGTFLTPRALFPHEPRTLSRLSFSMAPKFDYDAAKVGTLIEQCGGETLFFCDTSLFDDRTDAAIWQALLNREGILVIIPPVHCELEPWLAMHPDHQVAQAIARQDPAIQFFDYGRLNDWEITALTYYTNLLGFRKQLLRIRVMEFEDKFGHYPTANELAQVKTTIQREVGPRGFLLANKGFDKPLGPRFHTDEFLVCLAAMTAITTGREVVILTKDEDILEQFYKLQWLLDTHYRGMLLADLFAADPFCFPIYQLPKDVPAVNDCFQGDNGVLVKRSRQLLDDVLPIDWSPMPIYCALLGQQFTQTTFVAEPGMERLLQVKGNTGGLNTDRLQNRNCHIWTAPLDLPKHLRDCAVVAQDRRLQLRTESVAIPLLDIWQVLLTRETIPQIVEFFPELVDVPDGWLD